jgi:hypothetical protein
MYLKEAMFPEYIDTTVPFNSIYWHPGLATQSQLQNEHSNAIIHKYTDTAQLLDKGRKVERMYM